MPYDDEDEDMFGVGAASEYFEEDGWSDSDSALNPTTHALEALSATFGGPTKRKAVVSLADLYVEDDGCGHSDMHSSTFPNTPLRSPSRAGTIPGEHLGPLAKRQAVAVTSGNPFSTVGNYSGVFPGVVIGGDGKPIGPLSGSHRVMFLKGPTTLGATAIPPTIGPATVDWMRQRDEVFSILEDMTKAPSNSPDENKPYRCSVPGCDKTYKNPNGLKYHNQHGHSSTGLGEADNPDARPYVCTFLECGKRYKNLNGLKYHIEHTHPNLIAALRAHQAGLSNHPLLVNGAYVNHQAAAMTIAAALAAVEASPMMALAANAVLAAHATAAAAAAALANSNATLTPTSMPVSVNITPTTIVIGETTGEAAAANFEVPPVALAIAS
ncbi:Transcriptional regulator of ribosomal biogenesis protein [Dissophora ornata]|nr:Transcriptional regulator of ribosomal biogenesis protein [Dissophora ornata]